MAGLLDGILGGQGGILGGSYAQAAPLAEYSQPQGDMSVYGQNPGPGLRNLAGGGGFMSQLGQALGNPVTQFGLALASGKTPQEGFGNAVNAQLVRQRTEQDKWPTTVKEYQYAVATGTFRGSYMDFVQQQTQQKAQYGLNAVTVQKPDGTFESYQLNSQGPPRKVDFGDAKPLGPNQQYKDSGTEFVPAPSKMLPFPQRPTTSATDSEGRPVVVEGAGPVVNPPGIIPKNNIGKSEQGEIGKGSGENYNTIQEDAGKAIGTKNVVSRMRQLNDSAYEGAGAPGVQHFRSLLATFGVDPGKVPAGEEFNQLSNKMTMDALGGKLGAQISNTDRDFIAATNPSLSNTKEGRARLMDNAEKLADRKIETAKMASDYRKQNGNMVGFNEYMAKYAEEHPLFPKQGGGGRPSIGEVRRGYRFKGGDPSSPASWDKVQ